MTQGGKYLGWIDAEIADSTSLIGGKLRDILGKHAAYNQPPASQVLSRYTEQEIDGCLLHQAPNGQTWLQHCTANGWTLEEALKPIEYSKPVEISDEVRAEFSERYPDPLV